MIEGVLADPPSVRASCRHRQREHLRPTLLRLSVGIEAVEDLWTDVDRALRNAPFTAG
jgi:cystathionine beta-lyase/cystathionine gamma-synthase